MFALEVSALEKARTDLREVTTSDHAKALDALQRWQIAENALEFKVSHMNKILELADEIRGQITLEEALLMEKVRNEREPTTDTRPDTAGY